MRGAFNRALKRRPYVWKAIECAVRHWTFGVNLPFASSAMARLKAMYRPRLEVDAASILRVVVLPVPAPAWTHMWSRPGHGTGP